ncbi:DUF5110 domain-containing protein [Ferruginibacter lapsinanis]|uniref:TIM-barrel domain-containing protein n=1 Tax=Ferruginibacter lapsinanis TaxID=563172 RepID=UPI001E2C9FA1|nr:TIM-barrel domain-containing protein [Ferruginibacter lapsinanis]UEG49126.1 DUF5110 domain-containing protein [Ferruginibacter lapsinanis]
MKLKFSFFFLLVFLFSTGFAQKDIFKKDNGVYIFQQYSNNIIKVTYTPHNYTANENISDAVILKPTLKNTHKAKLVSEDKDHFMLKGIPLKGNKKIIFSDFLGGDNFRGFAFKLDEGERVFGGGERALPLNRRGYKFNLYNGPWYGYGEGADNLNYSVPFVMSNKGYGLFFDNPSRGYFDIGKTTPDSFIAGFSGGELNFYIILGKDYKEILYHYHQLTGTQPLPPRWALGNLMSRFGYTSQEQANDIVAKMKEQKVPVDAIIFDLFWFGDSIQNTLGNLSWVNKTKWPDPKKMIGDFKKQHINTILITEPFVVKSSSNYTNTTQYHAVDSAGKPYVLTNFYFGKGGLLDMFRKDARQWFWSKYKEQMKLGVESWWGDLGEPETHPADMYHNLKDIGFKRLFKADEVHNAYGNVWTKMLFDQYAKEYPTKRLFSLNRSGFAGTQRYGIFPWSGDVGRSWSGLRAQLPVMLGMSMSGIPYVHADAGGFAGGEGDNELYVRWLQFAAFTPIFRPHGTALGDVDKNAFSFPSEAALIEEPYRSEAKAAINLRYALLPYNYTLAYNQTKKGAPLVAPLYYYYPNDTTALNVGDEFMWGENILVAPVLEKGVKERSVYLPGGTWYELKNTFNSDLAYNTHEGSFVTPVLSNEIPAYVKAGSFIPMIKRPEGTNTSGYNLADFTVNYYADNKSSDYDLFDDDGVTKQSVTNGQFEIITFKAKPQGQQLTFTVSSKGGNYKGRYFVKTITFVIHGHSAAGKKLYVDDKLISTFGNKASSDKSYNFTVTLKNVPLKIEIK